MKDRQDNFYLDKTRFVFGVKLRRKVRSFDRSTHMSTHTYESTRPASLFCAFSQNKPSDLAVPTLLHATWWYGRCIGQTQQDPWSTHALHSVRQRLLFLPTIGIMAWRCTGSTWRPKGGSDNGYV